jgi:hypothetical protein
MLVPLKLGPYGAGGWSEDRRTGGHGLFQDIARPRPVPYSLLSICGISAIPPVFSSVSSPWPSTDQVRPSSALTDIFPSISNRLLARSSVIALMMEAVRASETSVNSYQSTRSYKRKDRHLHTHCRENLRVYLGVYWRCLLPVKNFFYRCEVHCLASYVAVYEVLQRGQDGKDGRHLKSALDWSEDRCKFQQLFSS